ncbi:MAG: DUF3795 domain-containing protein [Candidatus Bipolaricaulota bacterium]|nr:MAG: DUF3795 domain-containing protein [Candidatus Bipolaricaulota bacterium]
MADEQQQNVNRESTPKEERLDAPCGLYCGACDVYLATARGTQDVLANAWGRSVTEVTCRGCRAPVRAVFCRDCGIRSCAAGRRLEHCSSCPELPCEQLVTFRDSAEHHGSALRDLRRIKAVGVRSWLKEQHERWRCPACSREAGWYDSQCSRCGSPLVSCTEEDHSVSLE